MAGSNLSSRFSPSGAYQVAEDDSGGGNLYTPTIKGQEHRVVMDARRKLGKHDDLPLYPEDKKPERPRYLNIGAGRFTHPRWHNLDNPTPWYTPVQHQLDVAHDLASDLPFPIGSCTLAVAYTSHVIEHLKDRYVAKMFREVHRCLEPKGIFRVVCPDMELEYEAFRRGDDAFFYWRRFPALVLPTTHSVEQIFLKHFAAAVSQTHRDQRCPKFSDADVRRIFRRHDMEDFFEFFCSKVPEEVQKDHPQNHCNWFSAKKVTRMLRAAGFDEVYESRYGQSRSPFMRNTLLFDNSRPTSALYVEAIKS